MDRRKQAIEAVAPPNPGWRLVQPTDLEWPLEAFADLTRSGLGAPPSLTVRGEAPLPLLLRRAVVITGSRWSSRRANAGAAELAARLAADGITVVSGGGYGVDANAHLGALGEYHPGIVVTASGVDVATPAGNAKLFDDIVAHGGLVLSEQELGTRAHPRAAGMRARLVAALGAVVVIVERRDDGVQFATERYARELDRLVLAPSRNDGAARPMLFDEPGRSVDAVLSIVHDALAGGTGFTTQDQAE